MRNKNLMNKRNKKIQQEYQKLAKEIVSDKIRVPKYRHTAILAILSEKFYLQPDYIQNIICKS